MPPPPPAQLTIAGVPLSLFFGEGVQTITEQVTEQGPQATVVFNCAWADRYAVVKGLMGSVSSSGAFLSRVPPTRYPPSPNLVCTAITSIVGIKPRRDDSRAQGVAGWVAYQEAVLTAVFTRPTFQIDNSEPAKDPSGTAYCTTKFKTSAEIFSPPVGAYFYQAGSAAGQQVAESSFGEVRSRCEVSMTRHKLPAVPLKLCMRRQGLVNDAPVRFADFDFPRGCLLFNGMSSDPQSDPATAEVTQEIELAFLGNESIEWNEIMGPDGQYVLINTRADGSGDPPFKYMDFSVFFSDEVLA